VSVSQGDPGVDLFAPLTIVAGKGGVGKTTVASALATLSAERGAKVLVVATDSSPGWSLLFDRPRLTHAAIELAPGIEGRCLTPDESLREWLDDRGLKRLSGRLMKLGILDVVATAAPGIADLLVLGKIKALVRSGQWDHVIVDAPAAGHALTFLQSPRGLADAVGSGAIREQADGVLTMLAERETTSVVLVTLAAETPVSELIETAFRLEDMVDVGLGPVVVNQVLPVIDGLDALAGAPQSRKGADRLDVSVSDALVAAAAHRFAQQRHQRAQLDRMADQLPVPQFHLGRLGPGTLGPAERATLVDQLRGQSHQ
jgi:anion-transporting  ArsA/GET3 family ATPase